jgi:hypothetical protein
VDAKPIEPAWPSGVFAAGFLLADIFIIHLGVRVAHTVRERSDPSGRSRGYSGLLFADRAALHGSQVAVETQTNGSA